MEKSLDLITIGESLIEFSSDKSIASSENFIRGYGGDALTSAIAALRFNLDVGYITKVKNDGFGQYLLDCWLSEGLDSGQVRFDELPNGVYFLGTNNKKQETLFYRRKTAASQLSVSDIDFEYIKNAKYIYTTGFVQSVSLTLRETVHDVMKFAKENNITVCYYPNFSSSQTPYNEALEMFEQVKDYIDILFLNSDDAKVFDTQGIDNLITRILDLQINKTVIIKADTGIYSAERTSTEFVKNPLDIMTPKIGYYSSVIGTYMACKLKGLPEVQALKFSALSGALHSMKNGAVSSIPTQKELEEQIGKYYG